MGLEEAGGGWRRGFRWPFWRTTAQQGLAALMNILLQKFALWMRSENLCASCTSFLWHFIGKHSWPGSGWDLGRTWPNLKYYYAKWPAEPTPVPPDPLVECGLHLCDFKSSWECN